MIGLSGAHRTGKSSLAKAFAEKNGLEFVQTSASAIFKEMGYDPAVTYDFATRLTIQEQILKSFERDFYSKHSAKDVAVTDRTPIDMLAYTLAEAIGTTVRDEDQERLAKYVRDCFDVMNRRFTTLIVVQPGIALVAEEGKAALNLAYIEHLNSIILGLSVDERIKVAHFYIPRHLLDMADRIGAVEFAVGRVRTRMLEDRESSYSTIH